MGILLMAISRRHEENLRPPQLLVQQFLSISPHIFSMATKGITQAVPIVPGFATLTEAFFSANQSTFRGRNVR
jgi:hypothetical protein